MNPTDAQVEELARWLNQTFVEAPGSGGVAWERLSPDTQRYYRITAHALLTRPPRVLVDVLGLPVPDAVAGGPMP